MDTSIHNLQTLFAQLGLPASDDAIEEFVNDHTLDSGLKINEASFWNASQTEFLEEAIYQGSDWAEIVDLFDLLLRIKR